MIGGLFGAGVAWLLLRYSRVSALTQDAEKVRQLRSRLESILNVAQRLRLRCFRSAAALLDGLFEHPAWYSSVVMDSKFKKHWHVQWLFRSR